MSRMLWVHTPTKEAHGATGFVELDDDVADALIAADKAQELNVGALYFREVQAATVEPAKEYETRDTAAKPRGRKGK